MCSNTLLNGGWLIKSSENLLCTMSIVPGSTNPNPEVSSPGSQLLTGPQLEQVQQRQHQATLSQRHASLYGDRVKHHPRTQELLQTFALLKRIVTVSDHT
jgi:hypothetical protein